MRTTLGFFACLVLFVPATAGAHAYIKVPGNRVNDTTGGGKTAPCGGFAGSAKPATAAYQYLPGQQVQITINDPIQHNGHYELWWSTDNDGTFTVLPGQDNIAAPATANVDTNVMVTMPAATCANCTLQLRFFMVDTGTYYYSCADIRLGVPMDMAGTPPEDMAVAGTDDMGTDTQTDDMGVTEPGPDMSTKPSAAGAGIAGCTMAGSSTGAAALGTLFLFIFGLSLVPVLRQRRAKL